MAVPDDIDRKLIRLLQQDARMSNKALAEAVGLSQSSCLRRLRLLEDSGVIESYTAVLVVQSRHLVDRIEDEFFRL